MKTKTILAGGVVRPAWVLCLGLMSMLLLPACQKEEQLQEETPASTEAIAVETQTHGGSFSNVTGLAFYENGRAINENGDVFLTAVLDAEAQVEAQYITSVALYDMGQEHLLVAYTLSDDAKPLELEDGTYETWLASYNMITGQVDGTVQLPLDSNEEGAFVYSYQEQVGGLLWNRQMADDVLTATAYDSQLQQVAVFTSAQGVDGYGYFPWMAKNITSARTE